MKRAVALFDFDKTLTTHDSIYLLWRYAIIKNPFLLFYFLGKLFPALFSFLFTGDFRKLKNGLLSIFHKMDDGALEVFVTEELPKHFLKDGVEEVKRLKKEGYYLLLVSASPEHYLKYVTKLLPFDGVLGTKTDRSYRLTGKNNRGEEKVRRIEEHLKGAGIVMDKEKSRSYSDSYKADHPMMELTAKGFIINAEAPQGYFRLNWK